MEDLIQALVKKAKIPDETEGGRIRVYETSSNRFYREPARDQSVLNLNEYTQIFAERIPEEELAADDNNFIHVFHFQNEVNRVHGVPFKFLLLEVSTLKDASCLTPVTYAITRARSLPTPRRDLRSGQASRARALRRSSLLLQGGQTIQNHNILMMVRPDS